MKLYHGSYSNTQPQIKTGAFALSLSDNVFDGLFASDEFEVANSHGDYVYEYKLKDNKIATSSDLDVPDVVFEVLKKETNIEDEEKLEALYEIVLDDADLEELEEAGIEEADLNCRASCDFENGAASWEIQRLRGRIAYALGFDAVECKDEHGTSYLIVRD